MRSQEPDGGFQVLTGSRELCLVGQSVIDAGDGEAIAGQRLKHVCPLVEPEDRLVAEDEATSVDPDDQRRIRHASRHVEVKFLGRGCLAVGDIAMDCQSGKHSRG